MRQKLSQRLVSAGPVDNNTYKQLNKVANANGHATVETMMGDMLAVIATDEDSHIWVPVALTKEDHQYAVELWEEDFRVMLDQLLGDALDRVRRG
jgi:L-lactate utilization protein LutB